MSGTCGAIYAELAVESSGLIGFGAQFYSCRSSSPPKLRSIYSGLAASLTCPWACLALRAASLLCLSSKPGWRSNYWMRRTLLAYSTSTANYPMHSAQNGQVPLPATIPPSLILLWSDNQPPNQDNEKRDEVYYYPDYYDDNTLSAGAIAGIVIGIIAFLLILACLCALLTRRRRRPRRRGTVYYRRRSRGRRSSSSYHHHHHHHRHRRPRIVETRTVEAVTPPRRVYRSYV